MALATGETRVRSAPRASVAKGPVFGVGLRPALMEATFGAGDAGIGGSGEVPASGPWRLASRLCPDDAADAGAARLASRLLPPGACGTEGGFGAAGAARLASRLPTLRLRSTRPARPC